MPGSTDTIAQRQNFPLDRLLREATKISTETQNGINMSHSPLATAEHLLGAMHIPRDTDVEKELENPRTR